MSKRVLLRIVGFMAGIVMLVNCAGCNGEQKHKKSNTSSNIEVETIEVEQIEVEEIEVKYLD